MILLSDLFDVTDLPDVVIVLFYFQTQYSLQYFIWVRVKASFIDREFVESGNQYLGSAQPAFFQSQQ